MGCLTYALSLQTVHERKRKKPQTSRGGTYFNGGKEWGGGDGGEKGKRREGLFENLRVVVVAEKGELEGEGFRPILVFGSRRREKRGEDEKNNHAVSKILKKKKKKERGKEEDGGLVCHLDVLSDYERKRWQTTT